MQPTLPPGVTRRRFVRALRAFEGVVGEQWVLSTDEELRGYLDPYALIEARTYGPSAAVAPHSVEETQAVVRIANEGRIPLWPISRGKNLGYGGSAPVMAGTVILDLSRMNRILEVNEQFGYCVLEPGVGFFDLFEYLQKNDIPLWMSSPANAWGSVVGNALERGIGGMPYGEHASKVCGLEVVLPDGGLVRTGMGAMSNNSAWHLFKDGFGPSWDQMFMQSNFGVVTKMGLWLMPAPESTISMNMSLPEETDLEWAVDVLWKLRVRGVMQNNPSIGNAIRTVTMYSQRDEWFQGRGPIPDEVLQKLMKKWRLGWWNFGVRLFGYEKVNDANAEIIKSAFAEHTKQEFSVRKWKQGEPFERSAAVLPSTAHLHNANWYGGRGGHLDFSPVLPPSGAHAMKQYRMTKKLYEEYGFDYSGGFTFGERHLKHISMILFDKDDAEMTDRAHKLFKRLIQEAAREGYGEYRTHVNYMDDVARSFDFNEHALLRLNERVKDALDPNGVIAPGKQGIWPKALRRAR